MNLEMAPVFGIIVMVLIAVAQFFFAYRAHARAEQSGLEPKHQPTIEAKIESRVLTSESRLAKDLEILRREHKEDVNQLHGRVSNLRDELQIELKDTRQGIERAAVEIKHSVDTSNAQLNRLIGAVEVTQQQQRDTAERLNRHIENHD
jgi:uncharacterized protein (DUF885 family)